MHTDFFKLISALKPKNIWEVGVGNPAASRAAKFIDLGVPLHLFEPLHLQYSRLVESFGGRENVKIYQVAISDIDAEVNLVESNECSFIEGVKSPTVYMNERGQWGVPTTKSRVQAKPISFYDDGHIDILLIDTEGNEWKVLSTLISRPRLISVETHMHDSGYQTVNLDKIREWLKNNGYHLIAQDVSDEYYLIDGAPLPYLGGNDCIMGIEIDDRPFANLPQLEMQSLLSTASHNFFGLEMQQHPQALFKLNQLLRLVSFDRIIEIGCLHGGFSFFFALYAAMYKKEFRCYDISDTGYHIPLLKKLFNCFYKQDVINDTKNVEELRALISSPGRTLLICDAGKAAEYNLYAGSLKVGDFIMTHDFAPTPEFFEEKIKGRHWNWMENWYERIKDETIKNNIVHTSYFNDVVWSCGWKAR